MNLFEVLERHLARGKTLVDESSTRQFSFDVGKMEKLFEQQLYYDDAIRRALVWEDNKIRLRREAEGVTGEEEDIRLSRYMDRVKQDVKRMVWKLKKQSCRVDLAVYESKPKVIQEGKVMEE